MYQNIFMIFLYINTSKNNYVYGFVAFFHEWIIFDFFKQSLFMQPCQMESR